MPRSNFVVLGTEEENEAHQVVKWQAGPALRADRRPTTPNFIVAWMIRNGYEPLIPHVNMTQYPGVCDFYGECAVSCWRCNVTEVMYAPTRAKAIADGRELLGSSGLCGSVRRQDRRNSRTAQRVTRRTQRTDFRQDERSEARESRGDTRESREELRQARSDRGAGFSGFVGDIAGGIGSIMGGGGAAGSGGQLVAGVDNTKLFIGLALAGAGAYLYTKRKK